MSKKILSRYYDKAGVEAAVNSGDHRAVVGGLWEEIGQLQLEFLLSRGLKPQHKLLDIGCGSLRAGVKLVRYLEAGNYFGTDINQSLLTAGYEIELANECLTHKLARSHLVADGEFDFSWCPVAFDFVLAQSVFTHLPLNFLRICLEGLHKVVSPGVSFYATIFEIPEDHPTCEPCSHPGGITSHGAKDPYHYRFSDMEFCCRNLPWTAVRLGEWNHPRSQHMIEFIRAN
jgi:SAM-dependent methyltransferase